QYKNKTMKRESVILELEYFKKLINNWHDVEYSKEDARKVRSEINKKRTFVEEMVNQTGCGKRFDWSPPPRIGGFPMKGINPFDVFFEPPYKTNVTSMITDSIDQTIGIIENLDTFAIMDESKEKLQEKTKTNTKTIVSKKVFI